MNRRIENNLEDYLQGTLDSRARGEFERDLGESDVETRQLVQQFESHSQLIRGALRPPADLEPAAGFYARVMERIEARRANSIWSAFLEPLFFRRLALASAALLMLLGITIFASNPTRETMVAENDVQAPEVELARTPEPLPVPVTGVSMSDSHRDAMLVDLTTYQE